MIMDNKILLDFINQPFGYEKATVSVSVSGNLYKLIDEYINKE